MRALVLSVSSWLFCLMVTFGITSADCHAGSDQTETWPMWRHDATRSASSGNSVPDDLEELWKRSFGKRTPVWDDPLNNDLMTYDHQFEPVVGEGLLFIGFNDQDKIMALDTETGATRWSFYGEGPFRLPPVLHGDTLLATCDDGHLYCIEAQSGELRWKFFGAPNTQKVLGNRRLISAWPTRGGAVVRDDIVYFANSIWPFMGTFIYALHADTGEVQWINDNTGAQYIKQPHSAPAFAGVAPQGSFVATHDRLVVPGGRSVPAVFDRSDGSLKHFELNAGGKGAGGSFVTADKVHFYVHTRLKGTRAFHTETGLKTAFMPNEPVIDGDVLYSATVASGKPIVQAFRANLEDDKDRAPLWSFEADGTRDLIGARNHLIAAGQNSVQIISKPTLTGDQWTGGNVVCSKNIDGNISRLILAAQKVFVVTDAGDILALGELPGDAVVAESTVAPELAQIAKRKSRFAEHSNAPEFSAAKLWLEDKDADGYAFWFGKPSDAQVQALVESSVKYEQIAIVTDDAIWAARIRKELDSQGMYGKITVHISAPTHFKAPQYIASRIVVSELSWVADESRTALKAIYDSVRPYGGKLLVLVDQDSMSLAESVRELDLEKGNIAHIAEGLQVERVGALPDTADWTHMYGDVGNTVKSNDARVKPPLGLLWFGASSNLDVLPRHGHGPSQQVVGGRLFIQGMNSLSARDVYNGRVLWKREFEDLGTFDVYYDATHEHTPLDPKYNQVHIPGANGRGTNYIVTEDRVYLIVKNECLILDPRTGEDLGKIVMPADEDGSTPEWGYIAVYKDLLIGGQGFANYRTQHGVSFEEEEKDFSGNKAGFASKSLDRAASRGLVAFDRKTGDFLWKVSANHSFWHNGIVAGNDKIFCLDRNPEKIEGALKRRGKKNPNTYRILALDYRTGEARWEISEHVFGTWLGYSEKHDALLQAGAKASDRLSDEVGQGMRVYEGTTGTLRWAKDSLKLLWAMHFAQ